MQPAHLASLAALSNKQTPGPHSEEVPLTICIHCIAKAEWESEALGELSDAGLAITYLSDVFIGIFII
jgi:hypothetical protein